MHATHVHKALGNAIFSAETEAVTIFVHNFNLKVYNGAGPNGDVLAELDLRSSDGSLGNSNDKLAFFPQYPTDASTYFFNLGDMITGLDRRDSCTLFASENDYPRVSPVRSVGADGIGNHIGKAVFGKETYTFWITYDQPSYVFPHSYSYDWEAQIVCVMQ